MMPTCLADITTDVVKISTDLSKMFASHKFRTGHTPPSRLESAGDLGSVTQQRLLQSPPSLVPEHFWTIHHIRRSAQSRSALQPFLDFHCCAVGRLVSRSHTELYVLRISDRLSYRFLVERSHWHSRITLKHCVGVFVVLYLWSPNARCVVVPHCILCWRCVVRSQINTSPPLLFHPSLVFRLAKL